MRAKILMAIMIVLVSTQGRAQDIPSNIHQSTSSPPNARFEIVQSELAARWAFRLDRFTGAVAQLVLTKDNGNTWEDMPVIKRLPVTQPARARFQIFTSGLAACHTFLLDEETGRTWQIVTSKKRLPDGSTEEIQAWQPLEE